MHINRIDYVNEILRELKSQVKEKKVLDLIELGYVTNPCSIQVFGILTHCIENIKIFNNTQTLNIINSINKLSYV